MSERGHLVVGGVGVQQDSGLSTGKGKGIEQVIFQANLY